MHRHRLKHTQARKSIRTLREFSPLANEKKKRKRKKWENPECMCEMENDEKNTHAIANSCDSEMYLHAHTMQ